MSASSGSVRQFTRREELKLCAPRMPRDSEVLTPRALALAAELQREFGRRRLDLLDRRGARRRRIESGQESLGFLPETRFVRESDWRVAPAVPGLICRNVEITGPPSPKMTVNALNSGADVWMADFEDALTPTWSNLIVGHLSLIDALDGRLDLSDPSGKRYVVGEDPATLVMRPRGWHLEEAHVLLGDQPISASLFDFAVHLETCGERQLRRDRSPAFYLPKLESHLEARLWNDVFNFAQDYLDLPRGTIRATVLIETLPAAYEMDEILYELRDHAAGLNAGRWDYLFSMIKYLGLDSEHVLPDRGQVTMATPFLRAYAELLVDTCHRRGAHAIGGMAAAVPIKGDPDGTRRALVAVSQDKAREADQGFDGSWVAHPASVPTCRFAYDVVLKGQPHQKSVRHLIPATIESELVSTAGLAAGVTEAGVRGNLSIALHYLSAWLDGSGAVAIEGLMEDAATVEISRSQLWQWLRHGTRLVAGPRLDSDLLLRWLDEEAVRLWGSTLSEDSHHHAVLLLEELVTSRDLPDFFTTLAYDRWLVPESGSREATVGQPMAG